MDRLSNITTFGIGGPAEVVYPGSVEELIRISNRLRGEGVTFRVIGNGSNILAADEGCGGVVIVTNKMTNEGRGLFESGALLPRLAAWARDNGLMGLEWAAGIPATVGGAVFGNAGAYGNCMADIVRSVTVWKEGDIITYNTVECKFYYRDSIFKHEKAIILSVDLNLKQGDRVRIIETMNRYADKRRATQPQERSAGSIFKKLGDTPAWQLIDKAGLRGLQIGGAQISPKHANFIINKGGATARDVLDIIDRVTQKIQLEPEIIYLGEAFGSRRLPHTFCF